MHIYFIAAFILFYRKSLHMCQKTVQVECMGMAYANFPRWIWLRFGLGHSV